MKKPGLAALVALCLTVGIAPGRAAAPDTLLVVTETARHEIPLRTRERVDWIPLRALAEKLRLPTRAAGASLTVTAEDRELIVAERRNVATVARELRLLAAPCVVEAGDWWIPAASLEPLLVPLLRTPLLYRAGERALVVGNVAIPRVTVAHTTSDSAVEVTISASAPVPLRVSRPEGRLVVSLGERLVDVELEGGQPSGGVLEAIRLERGEPAIVMVTGPRFVDVRVAEAEPSRRLILYLRAAPSAAATPRAPAPTAPTPGLRTVVIDPGHGGSDVGVAGPGGVTEKEVTLRFAHLLRAALTTNLGIHVLLTREKDEDVPIDHRPGVANNFKAQLFVSLHANSRASGGWPGPQVFTQALLDDAFPPAAGPVADLESWALAQAAHLEAAARLAAELQPRLTQAMGQGRPAPRTAVLRALSGATMPALLVELGCLDDPGDAGRLASDAGQKAIVAALVAVISSYAPVQATP